MRIFWARKYVMTVTHTTILICQLITILVLGGGISAAIADIKDLSPLLERERTKHKLPAIAAIAIYREKIIAKGVSGVRKSGLPIKAQLKDRWHLGSCTKSITATMIGVLVHQGKLSWNTTVLETFPELADIMHPAYRDVTIEMLLSHRGGIRHEWDVAGLWDVLWKREDSAVEERKKMTQVMLSQPPKVKPGKYFYSNCGFSIAGHMAEVIIGVSWEELVKKTVFEPLEMKSAGFGVPWYRSPPTDPWPHKENGGPIKPGPFADNPPSIGPGGTIHSSIEDWGNFIIEHLKGAQGKNGRLLPANVYRKLHRWKNIEGTNKAYALGWEVLTREWAKGKHKMDKGICLHHAGSNNSWYALSWIAPERRFAVVITTNIGGDGIFAKIDAVVWAVIQSQLSVLKD